MAVGGGTHAIMFVARPIDAITDQVRGIVLTELITGGALILLLAAGGRWLIGRGLAPLGQMAGTAQRITTQGDLTARMPDDDDSTEVGRLGGAINTMLDRIQQAFGARLRSEQKVRQFAADASHELRTPLTTIRGYAELYRQGALGPDQLPNAMRRIEQEAQRMSTLVAELLELARLDRTSSLDLAETDLAGLVRDAAADASAVEPDRPVQAETPARLIAVVDEARIRQVLANLLGNVREHTPPGTPVAVRLAPVRGGVVLEVADAGPGMSEQDAAQAFDRFHRGADRAGRPGRRRAGRAAASACPSCRPSRPRTAARPSSNRGRARAPGSASSCPPRPRSLRTRRGRQMLEQVVDAEQAVQNERGHRQPERGQHRPGHVPEQPAGKAGDGPAQRLRLDLAAQLGRVGDHVYPQPGEAQRDQDHDQAVGDGGGRAAGVLQLLRPPGRWATGSRRYRAAGAG